MCFHSKNKQILLNLFELFNNKNTIRQKHIIHRILDKQDALI